MQFLDPSLEHYAENFSDPEPEYLRALAEETLQDIDMPQMLSGHLQGRLLALLSKLLRPRTVLDIGTFTGYSALCMAEGLASDGVLHTIDIKPDLGAMVARYIGKAGFQQCVTQHVAPALRSGG